MWQFGVGWRKQIVYVCACMCRGVCVCREREAENKRIYAYGGVCLTVKVFHDISFEPRLACVYLPWYLDWNMQNSIFFLNDLWVKHSAGNFRRITCNFFFREGKNIVYYMTKAQINFYKRWNIYVNICIVSEPMTSHF